MQNKRYYYDDPLAAAWMGQKFGMKFVSKEGKDVCLKAIYSAHLLLECEEKNFKMVDSHEQDVSRAYIHPDSLHILKPQIGDIGLRPEFLNVAIFDYRTTNCKQPNWVRCNDLVVIEQEDLFQIIQRNGIAFMWPKEEIIQGEE